MKSVARAILSPPKQPDSPKPTGAFDSRADAVATRARLINDAAFAAKVVDGDKDAAARLNQVDEYLRMHGGALNEDELKASYPERFV